MVPIRLGERLLSMLLVELIFAEKVVSFATALLFFCQVATEIESCVLVRVMFRQILRAFPIGFI